MTDTPRGPTTEQLRARALARFDADARREQYGEAITPGTLKSERAPIGSVLPRPCLACNREQGERMCDLCQRLELAEAAALDSDGAARLGSGS